jgi:hypothetical protein
MRGGGGDRDARLADRHAAGAVVDRNTAQVVAAA